MMITLCCCLLLNDTAATAPGGHAAHFAKSTAHDAQMTTTQLVAARTDRTALLIQMEWSLSCRFVMMFSLVSTDVLATAGKGRQMDWKEQDKDRHNTSRSFHPGPEYVVESTSRRAYPATTIHTQLSFASSMLNVLSSRKPAVDTHSRLKALQVEIARQVRQRDARKGHSIRFCKPVFTP